MSHLTEAKRRTIKQYQPSELWVVMAEKRTTSVINDRASFTTDLIVNKLNLPRNFIGKINVLSPSANKGWVEVEMMKQLPSDYSLITGDISKLTPLTALNNYYRGDAEYLPFKSGNFSLIYDFKGALWHQAHDSADGLLNQFEEYKRALLDKGIVLIDDATKLLIDPRLNQLKLKKIPGFTIPKKYLFVDNNVVKEEMYAFTKE